MKRIITTLLVLLLLAAAGSSWAASKEEQKMQDAIAVIHDFVNIPENAIPPSLLSDAYGIAVIPNVLKAGFIIGGRYGTGVLSVRTPDGSWSHPVFIHMGGASLGWQIGASSTDIILVFKTQRGIDGIINGEITLGGDASIAAGPVGRSASAATNLQLNSEIYSYSRSRGLFAGIALDGGVINIDRSATSRYYQGDADIMTILRSSDLSQLPKTGQRFVYTLNAYMPALHDDEWPVPYGHTGDSTTQSSSGAQPTGGSNGYGDSSSLDIRPYDSR